MGEKVGRELIAEIVALVHRGPEVSRRAVESNSNGVPQPTGVNPHVLTVRVGDEDSSAAWIGLNRDIRFRSDRNENSRAVRTEGERSRPMLVVTPSWEAENRLGDAEPLGKS